MDGGSITSRTFFSFFFFPLVRIPYNKHRFFPLSLFSLFLFFSTWAVLTRARNLWVHHFFFAPSARRALSLWRKKAANSLSATDCNANLSSCSTGAPPTWPIFSLRRNTAPGDVLDAVFRLFFFSVLCDPSPSRQRVPTRKYSRK